MGKVVTLPVIRIERYDTPKSPRIEIEKRLAWALLSGNDGIRQTAQKELLKLVWKDGKSK